MKITEVTNENRKIIKVANNLYLKYMFDRAIYDNLIDYLDNMIKSGDPELMRESDAILALVADDMSRLIKNISYDADI